MCIRDRVWPGIEIYYAELEKLAQTPGLMSRSSAQPEIHIENGTHNYVLEPEEDETADVYKRQLSYLSDCGERRGVFTQTVIGIIASAAFITFLLTILLTIIGFVFP